MASERLIRHCRRWYAKLLRLYPKAYHDRFGESMEQTFADLLCERKDTKSGLIVFVCWIFVETFAGIARENVRTVIVQNTDIIRIALVTVLILLVPLVAMRFTNEVAWDLTDFIVAGALIFGAGLTYELIARKTGNTFYRAAVAVAVATALALVWLNLAVGLIGSEDNPANLMYIGVLAVVIIGAFIARFRPRGMALALFATAVAQMSVSMVALIAGFGFTLILNGLFAALWVGSALLFRNAALKY